jgi:hypothetical protein
MKNIFWWPRPVHLVDADAESKVFWDNRVAASGLSQAQTRIPDAPDQTVFLSKVSLIAAACLKIGLQGALAEMVAVV